MERELETALATLDLTDADAAAVELARTYAHALDDEGPIDTLGPKLLSALEALGLTPRARAAVTKGVSHAAVASPLDQLRERRAARAHDTPTTDATA